MSPVDSNSIPEDYAVSPEVDQSPRISTVQTDTTSKRRSFPIQMRRSSSSSQEKSVKFKIDVGAGDDTETLKIVFTQQQGLTL